MLHTPMVKRWLSRFAGKAVIRLALVLDLAAAISAGSATAPAWTVPAATECLRFRLEEQLRLPRQAEPVRIPGREVLLRSSQRPLPVSSFRLFSQGHEIPLQIDERDNGPAWAATPNQVLDENDEIVFMVTLAAAASAEFELFYGTVPAAAPRLPNPELKVTAISLAEFSHCGYDLRLENARSRLGICAADPSSPERMKTPGTYNREGSIASLQIDGRELLDPYSPLLFTHFQDFATAWNGLHVTGRGPVRLSAVAHRKLDGIYRHGDGEWAVTWNDYAKITGDLYRTFTLYASSSRLEIRDDFTATDLGDDFTMNYRFTLRPTLAPGETWEKTRTILVPDGKGVRPVKFTEKQGGSALAEAERAAGWFAVQDDRTGTGLMVLYETATAYQAFWSLQRPWIKPASKTEWGAMTADLFVGTCNRDVLVNHQGANEFRLFALTGESPDDLVRTARAEKTAALEKSICWAPVWKVGKTAPAFPAVRNPTAKRLTVVAETLKSMEKTVIHLPQLVPVECRTDLDHFHRRYHDLDVAAAPADPAALRTQADAVTTLENDIALRQNSFAFRQLELFSRSRNAVRRGFAGYVEDTLVKVRPQGPIPENAPATARLTLARDEYEGFQVVLVPGREKVKDVQVTVSALKGPGRSVIPAENIRRYRVGFVASLKDGVPQAGEEWPDPLLPLPGCPDFPAGTLFPPEEAALGVLEADRLAPFWFTVHASADAAPGRYRGVVTFTAPGGSLEVPLEVTVLDFNIPQTWSLRSDLWFSAGLSFLRYYGSFLTLEEFTPIAEFMDTYRLTNQLSYLQVTTLLKVAIETDGSYSFDFSGLTPWYQLCLKRGNWFSADLSCNGGWTAHFSGVFGRTTPILDKRTGKTIRFPDATIKDVLETDLWKAFWPAYAKYLKENGWIDRCYIEQVDEPPYGPARKDEPRNVYLRRFHGALRQLAPELKLFNYGMGPSPDMHAWAEPLVDGWGPSLGELEKEKDYLTAQTKAGKPFLAYICGGSPQTLDRHVPDVYIDHPAIDLRIMPWMVYKYGGSGLLCYAGNGWVGDDAVNRVEKVPERRWPARPCNLDDGCGFGNGWFTYPAPRIKTIFPSIRLENIRDGLEDYEYLALLERTLKEKGVTATGKTQTAVALLDLDPLVKTVLLWSENPADLRQRRTDIGKALENLLSLTLSHIRE